MSRRYTYMTLRHQAAAKGINTFGDIPVALDMDGEDIWGTQWDGSLDSQPLFWCDGALTGLLMLESEGII